MIITTINNEIHEETKGNNENIAKIYFNKEKNENLYSNFVNIILISF